MKAALSIVLAGLLVTLPIKQVLAQAAQQDSTTAETSLVREQGSQPVIRVPALTPKTALLWQPFAENPPGDFVEPSLSERDAVDRWQEAGFSTAQNVALVLALVVIIVLIVLCARVDEKGGCLHGFGS